MIANAYVVFTIPATLKEFACIKSHNSFLRQVMPYPHVLNKKFHLEESDHWVISGERIDSRCAPATYWPCDKVKSPPFPDYKWQLRIWPTFSLQG